MLMPMKAEAKTRETSEKRRNSSSRRVSGRGAGVVAATAALVQYVMKRQTLQQQQQEHTHTDGRSVLRPQLPLQRLFPFSLTGLSSLALLSSLVIHVEQRQGFRWEARLLRS